MFTGYDIVILGGQSNAEGYGVGEVSEEYVCDEKVLFLSDDAHPRFEKDANGKDVFKLEFPGKTSVSVAEEPMGNAGKVGKLSLSFAKWYARSGLLKEGRRLLIVNAAVGGTGFARNEWGKDGILYIRLKHLTRDALAQGEGNRIVAFLWHQGECDSFENADWSPEKRYTTHKSNLSLMLDDLCETFDCHDLPMISAGFCDEWYLKNKTPCDAVMTAVREVFSEKSRRFLETSGLKSNNEKTGNGDDIHFCRESLHILGRRFFDAYSDIINGKGL